jgi:hypothetical protein
MSRTERSLSSCYVRGHASSSHNTLPWLFRFEDGLSVLANQALALPVVDLHERELRQQTLASRFT